MQRGYIKLYRKSVDNPLFKKPLVWHYFEYCLLKANHKDKKMIWNKKEITIERGSFITGRVQAAKETGLTERNIRTAISTLENLGMLFKNTEKSTSKFTYLTVCNYALYHDYENDNDQQVTSKRPASDQQTTTNKNVQTPIITKKKKEILKPENVSDQTWEDFLIHRKSKKASVTQTVINSFSKESKLAGISLEEAFIESSSRGWVGFKAEWMKDKSAKTVKTKEKELSSFERLSQKMNQAPEPEFQPQIKQIN